MEIDLAQKYSGASKASIIQITKYFAVLFAKKKI